MVVIDEPETFDDEPGTPGTFCPCIAPPAPTLIVNELPTAKGIEVLPVTTPPPPPPPPNPSLLDPPPATTRYSIEIEFAAAAVEVVTILLLLVVFCPIFSRLIVLNDIN
jgi:hypothetical protein